VFVQATAKGIKGLRQAAMRERLLLSTEKETVVSLSSECLTAKTSQKLPTDETALSNKANFADQISAVEELQATMPYIQLVLKQQGKVPCIILYTEEQISDIKRFCCAPITAQSTVLGVDKTFNLSDLHVTVTVFKNLALKRRTTGAHPIFCGPMFLHGNSDTDTFFLFFQHLAGKLADADEMPVLGSDEEAGMRQAMKMAFPDAEQMSCTRHLCQNFKAFLSDKVGMAKVERNSLVKSLFGKNGLVETCTNPMAMEDNISLIAQSAVTILQKYLMKLTKRAPPHWFDKSISL
jgi:hypothetical protein